MIKSILSKKLAGAVTVATFILTGAVNSFADVNVTSVDSVSIKDSVIMTAVIDTEKDINVNGEDVTITDIDTTDIDNSVINTLVKVKTEKVNASGQNIELTGLDSLNVNGSAIGTAIIEKMKGINVYNIK